MIMILAYIYTDSEDPVFEKKVYCRSLDLLTVRNHVVDNKMFFEYGVGP